MLSKWCLGWVMVCCCSAPALGQKKVYDKEKARQWTSIENGKWDFSPDMYYWTFHRKYSGASLGWEWEGLQSGLRVKFNQKKSDVKQVMPVRITAEETQRMKVKKIEEQQKLIQEMYQEELQREADRNVDLAYPVYQKEFNRMQERIAEGLLYCMRKSGGDLNFQVSELKRQNEMICEDIAYIHKMGIGFGLENTKRQKAYEEAKMRMGALLNRIAQLCVVASTHY